MKQLILITMLLLQNKSQICEEGCISCKDNQCLICDSLNGYYQKQDFKCEKTDQNVGCLYFKQFSQECEKCTNSYYLENGKCIFITSDQKIEGCRVHQNLTICSICEPGFILKDNTSCVQLTKTAIPNCLKHNSSEDLCEECDEDYVLSLDQKQCQLNPSIRYCEKYSLFSCNGCNQQSLLLRNSYLEKIKQAVKDKQIATLYTLYKTYDSEKIDFLEEQTCYPRDKENCRTYQEDSNLCAFCNDGHFLENGECFEYPKEPIPNCDKYISADKCHSCKQGFHLSNESTCTANGEITNCNIFDTKSSTTQCLQCIDSHFSLGSSCQERQVTKDTNCTQVSNTKDECETCATGFTKYDNNKKCGFIENCQVLQQNTESLICQKCKDKFYLENNTCTQGQINNCKVYTSKTSCQQCEETHYLINNTINTNSQNLCQIRQVSDFNKCEQFDIAQEDKCSVCQDNSLLFNITSSCRQIETKANCAVYSDFNQCQKCEDNFRLNQEGNCLLIDQQQNPNCIQQTLDTCQKCREQFLLINNNCVAADIDLDGNCKQNNLDGTTNNYDCEYCNDYHIQVQYNDEFVCRQSSDLTLLDQCLKYANDGKCELCQNEYILKDDKSGCVTECEAGEVIIIGETDFAIDQNITSGTFNSFKQCKTNNQVIGCKYASYGLLDHKLNCLECKSGYVAVEKCNADLCFYEGQSDNTDDLGTSFIGVFCRKIVTEDDPATTVVEEADVFYPNRSTPDPNCHYYNYDGNSTYYCQKCKFGQTGPIGIHNNMYYLDCSFQIQNCLNVMMGGTGWDIDWLKDMYDFTIPQVFSCYKCSQGIPFIHLDLRRQKKPYQLNSNDDIPQDAQVKDGHLISCRQPTQEGLQMTTQQFQNFPENCALGYYNISNQKLSDTTKIKSTATCLACDNGYKPVYDNLKFMIVSCQRIDNCQQEVVQDNQQQEAGWYNNCKTCLTGFTHKFFDNKIFYDNCVQNSIQNCFAGLENGDCKICHKGYNLNADGKCDQIKPPFCQQYNTKFVDFNDTNKNQKSSFYYFSGKSIGCQQCDNNFVPQKQTIKQCASSEYLQQNNGTFNQTNYINNCLNYSLNGNNLRCKVCKTGFSLDENNAACHPQLTGCSIVLFVNPSLCHTCSTGFTNINNNCIPNSILDCKVYQQNVQSLVCTQCNDGFYLINNTCKIGSIQNCKEYSSENKCAKCQNEHILLQGLVDQCIKQTDNCLEYANNTQNIDCLKCKEGFFKTTDDSQFYENDCITIQNIQNCVEYDLQNNIQQSTFKCLKCNDNHYLLNNKCIERSNLDSNCQKYFVNKDECEICNENFLLENKKCIAIEIGVGNCATYINKETCKYCNTGYYLELNQCIKTDLSVDNCNFISVQTVDCTTLPEDQRPESGICKKAFCEVCRQNFYKTDDKSKCRESIINNCNEQEKANICAKCVDNFFKETSTVENDDDFTTKTDCVTKDLPNCKIVSKVGEQVICSQCNDNFYYGTNDAGEELCIEIEAGKIISDCQDYQDGETCKLCNDGLILSADKKKCTTNAFFSNKFPQCVNLVELDQADCVVCKPGYYFNSAGQCEPCNDSQGCLFCDPQNSIKCLICRPGYNATNDGLCELNASVNNINDGNQQQWMIGPVLSLEMLIFFTALYFQINFI